MIYCRLVDKKRFTEIPDERIREIIRFVRPNGIGNFDVKVTNSRDICKGKAYTKGCSLHDTSHPFINIGLTRSPQAFPYYCQYESRTITKSKFNAAKGLIELYSYKTGTGGYINNLILSREEALVHVIAHELRHLWQSKVKRGRRVWGARGKFSDRDAYAYAIRMTRKWRSVKNGKTDALEQCSNLEFLR